MAPWPYMGVLAAPEERQEAYFLLMAAAHVGLPTGEQPAQVALLPAPPPAPPVAQEAAAAPPLLLRRSLLLLWRRRMPPLYRIPQWRWRRKSLGYHPCAGCHPCTGYHCGCGATYACAGCHPCAGFQCVGGGFCQRVEQTANKMLLNSKKIKQTFIFCILFAQSAYERTFAMPISKYKDFVLTLI